MRSQADKLARDTKQGVDKADAKIERYSRDAKAELDKTAKNAEGQLNKAIDSVDKGVSEVRKRT